MSETADTIRADILSYIDSKYDSLPGSLVFEISQGLAQTLESKYVEAEDALQQKFAGTADFDNLKVIAYERGVDWKDATAAHGLVTIVGVVGTVIPIGTAVANTTNEYLTTAEATIGTDGTVSVAVSCFTLGLNGNTAIGTITIFPKTISGLNTVTNPIAFANGYAAETRDELLARYYAEIRTPATSGNAYHYQKWALSISGVGSVKVKPLWNGNGTVKVVIITSNKEIATIELINQVAAYIETVRPIGPQITVTTAETLAINVSCKISLETDYTLADVKAAITANIQSHFKEITFDKTSVYYAKVGNIIFDTAGVTNIDYSAFTLNGASTDVTLIDNNIKTQIPILGTISVTV
jgi:uncharacterized phage protein gp47/JayE